MARERTHEQKIRRKFVGAAQVAMKKALLVNTETTGRLALVGVYDGKKFIVGDVSLLESLQCSAGAVQQVLADQEYSGQATTRLPCPQNLDIRTFLAPESSSVLATGYDSATMSDAGDEFHETQSFSVSQPNSSGNVSPPAAIPALQPSLPITGTNDWLSGSSFSYFDTSFSQLEQDTLFCEGGEPTLLPSMSTEESLAQIGSDSTASVQARVEKQRRRKDSIKRLKSRNFFV